ncbi:hypothetical protein HMPREF9144_2330 [Prevotella pallens ATCC 700821]|uniref:Uncharacterized protein n=1 Tax=Prevotella pallens ATCC 700821 TaxID=997353 RepID=F9DKY8_9BACT|nr:hypothetical protein HMPREF9144_2330 [Prevotella pallens ATCC 700821]
MYTLLYIEVRQSNVKKQYINEYSYFKANKHHIISINGPFVCSRL